MTSAPAERAVTDLLSHVFCREAADLFIVLRNGELLPAAFEGTDLDVCAMPGVTVSRVADFLEQRAARAGWSRVIRSWRPHMVALSLVHTGPELQVTGIHFDVFDGVRLWGVPLCAPEQLATESVVDREVRQLTARGRVLATLSHHLAWTGMLSKDKYRTELERVAEAPTNRRWLLDRLAEVFGSTRASEILAPGAAATLGSGRSRRRREKRPAAQTRSRGAPPMGTVM
jgi:hypothetical protein